MHVGSEEAVSSIFRVLPRSKIPSTQARRLDQIYASRHYGYRAGSAAALRRTPSYSVTQHLQSLVPLRFNGPFHAVLVVQPLPF